MDSRVLHDITSPATKSGRFTQNMRLGHISFEDDDEGKPERIQVGGYVEHLSRSFDCSIRRFGGQAESLDLTAQLVGDALNAQKQQIFLYKSIIERQEF
ncbi:hypothetical protein QE152_g5392 [Popillia japonica]|uniref:Uncharacterized protein n=1 Tax=Popillia japonica TaxID=7064 RepID=A0AAW1MMJ9_POPJA